MIMTILVLVASCTFTNTISDVMLLFFSFLVLPLLLP